MNLVDHVRERWGYTRPQALTFSILATALNKASLLIILYGVLARSSAGYGAWAAYWVFLVTACGVWVVDHVQEPERPPGAVRRAWVSKSLALKLLNKMSLVPILGLVMYRAGAGFGEWASLLVFSLTSLLIWFFDHVLDVDGSGD